MAGMPLRAGRPRAVLRCSARLARPRKIRLHGPGCKLICRRHRHGPGRTAPANRTPRSNEFKLSRAHGRTAPPRERGCAAPVRPPQAGRPAAVGSASAHGSRRGAGIEPADIRQRARARARRRRPPTAARGYLDRGGAACRKRGRFRRSWPPPSHRCVRSRAQIRGFRGPAKDSDDSDVSESDCTVLPVEPDGPLGLSRRRRAPSDPRGFRGPASPRRAAPVRRGGRRRRARKRSPGAALRRRPQFPARCARPEGLTGPGVTAAAPQYRLLPSRGASGRRRARALDAGRRRAGDARETAACGPIGSTPRGQGETALAVPAGPSGGRRAVGRARGARLQHAICYRQKGEGRGFGCRVRVHETRI